MAYSNYEFPHSSYYDADLRELLALYKDLKATYDGLQDEINKLLEYIDTLPQTVDQIVKEQIAISISLYQQRLANVEALVKALETHVNNLQGEVDTFQPQINQLYIDLQRNVQYFQNLHNELIEQFHIFKNGTSKYLDERMDEIEAYLYEVATKLDHLDVINPINGRYEDVNKVLADIYASITVAFGITAKEYDSLQLTAQEYDRTGISAIDYSSKAYFIFWELRQGMMRSPFTGKMTNYKNVIYKLSDLHKCCITAKQYEDLSLTAQEFDAWIINAFNYDWYGRQMILKREGITASNYDAMELSAKDYDKEMLTASRYDIYGNAVFTIVDPETLKCMACNPDVLHPITNKI